MPRSSGMKSAPSSSRHSPVKIPVPPPYAVGPFRPASPSTGQMLKESITSGIGSGIGFSIGNRLTQSIFGSSTATATAITTPTSLPSPPQNISEFQQCQHNAFDGNEKLLCMNLYSSDASYTEFKQCMKSSDNQIHMCKEFLSKH